MIAATEHTEITEKEVVVFSVSSVISVAKWFYHDQS